MMKIEAVVNFFSEEKGGYSKAILPGIKPLFRIGEYFTSAIINPIDPVDLFEKNVDYQVIIELPLGHHYADGVKDGMLVQLNDGNRIIGNGHVNRILDPGIKH